VADGGDIYFCIDGGGTKSRARVLDHDGATLAEALGGPCNPATNQSVAVGSIVALWKQCCAAMGRDSTRLDGVVMALGAAGVYVEAGRRAFLAACPQFARFCAMSDGYAALIGAGEGAPCGLLIAGTGVAGHRLYANGFSIQRDAWGWIAGDRGSGCWIGLRALRHCLATLDGVAPKDGLSEAVMKAVGGVEGFATGWMRDLGPDRLGALAPVVFAEADAGDAMALRIRDRAVEHLAALARVVAGPDVAFYAAGGIVAPLRALLEKAIGFAVLAPISDAMAGCWLVASGRAPPERALLFGANVEGGS
jgi:glucosamine kinase